MRTIYKAILLLFIVLPTVPCLSAVPDNVVLGTFTGDYNQGIDFLGTADLLEILEKEGKNTHIKSNELFFAEAGVQDDIRRLARDTSYVFRYDINNDGTYEIVIQLIVGSGGFPHFLILQYDETSNDFFAAYYAEEHDLPFVYENNLYFSREFFNWDAGLFYRIELTEIDRNFNVGLIQSYQIEYNYILSDEVKRFITNDEIRHIQNSNFDFLNDYIAQKTSDTNFSVTFHGYMINVSTVYSSRESYLRLTIYQGDELLNDFMGLPWGFTLREIQGEKYLTLLNFSVWEGITVSSRKEFSIQVYRLPDFEIVYSNPLFEPIISLKVID
jgi:hypothetical protein